VIAGLKEGEKLSGEAPLSPDSDLVGQGFTKSLASRQDISPQAQIADSSSTNAVSFSSARTTNRLPVVAMCVCNPDRSPVGINR
jgi:hypothetical protein